MIAFSQWLLLAVAVMVTRAPATWGLVTYDCEEDRTTFEVLDLTDV